MRIVSWNIENLAPYLRDEPSRSLVELIERLGAPDVLCLQEVRIRPGDADLVDRMRRALPGYTCHFALNRDSLNGGYRGGRAYGVATYLRDDLAAQPLTFPWDHEGRLVVSGIASMGLAIGNVYAVNGTSKPYIDPDTGARLDSRHEFKRRFIQRYFDECRALQRAGLSLVLVGDWNVSRSTMDVTPRLRTEAPHAAARAQLNDEFMPGLDLVDVFREHHPNARAYTWMNKRARFGKDAARVDYALVERALLPSVRSTGIDDQRPWSGSDHVPLWVELASNG